MVIIRLGNKDLQVPGANDPSQAGPVGPGGPSPIAGVTAPMYGMPMSGTPIGLPGPPHLP